MSAAADTVGIPKAAALTWQAVRNPDFWSIVAHAGMVYARTEAGLVWWDDSNRLWCSVKRNPFDVYCMGLAAGPTAAQPIYALEGHFLFVSYDGCRSWERRLLPFSRTPGKQMALAADPFMPFAVYLFGQTPAAGAPNERSQYGLQWSFDAGRTWDGPLTAGPAAKTMSPGRHGFLAVAADPSLYGSGGLFMATGRGLYRWFGLPFAGGGAEPLLELPESDPGAIVVTAVGPRAKNPIAIVVNRGMEAPDQSLQVSLDLGKSWTVRNPYPHPFFVDDLLYIDDLLFVKLVHWDPAQGDKQLGAILLSRDNGESYVDITAPDMVTPLTHQMPTGWPREGLAASPTHLYVMSRTMDTRSIALSSLRAVAG